MSSVAASVGLPSRSQLRAGQIHRRWCRFSDCAGFDGGGNSGPDSTTVGAAAPGLFTRTDDSSAFVEPIQTASEQLAPMAETGRLCSNWCDIVKSSVRAVSLWGYLNSSSTDKTWASSEQQTCHAAKGLDSKRSQPQKRKNPAESAGFIGAGCYLGDRRWRFLDRIFVFVRRTSSSSSSESSSSHSSGASGSSSSSVF